MDKKHYVFLDDNGNVKSTLVTHGDFKESNTILKVDDVSPYIGAKKVVNGKVENIETPQPQVIDISKLTDSEKLNLIIEKLGL